MPAPLQSMSEHAESAAHVGAHFSAWLQSNEHALFVLQVALQVFAPAHSTSQLHDPGQLMFMQSAPGAHAVAEHTPFMHVSPLVHDWPSLHGPPSLIDDDSQLRVNSLQLAVWQLSVVPQSRAAPLPHPPLSSQVSPMVQNRRSLQAWPWCVGMTSH